VRGCRSKAEFGTRKVVKSEMKARTPSQAGNLLSALRGMIRWINEDHLDEDDDPTIGVRSVRLGDAHRFGPPHLRQIVSKKMPTHYIAQANRQ
jgi:hypothetical protein